MFVWRELEDGDTVTIKREGERFRVIVARPQSGACEQDVTVREVRCAAHDVIITLVRRVLQSLKNNQR